MAEIEREQLFESRPIPSAVASLCVPTILSSLVMVLYNMADTYFVGLLNDPVETAAVTLAAPVLLAFNAVNNLFGVGSSSMMSRAMGRREMETVYRCSAFGFYGALISGGLFSLLCTVLRAPLLTLLGADAVTGPGTDAYLLWTVTIGAIPSILNVVMAYLIRSEGAALHASIGTMSGCLLNVVLDPIFILPWGFGMGAAGAGLATCLSNLFALVYFLIYLAVKRRSTCVRISPRYLTFRRQIVLGVCAVGVPASIQNLLNVVGSTVLNNLAAGYATTALAAMGICVKINMVPMYIGMGFSQGVMPLISYNYSSGNSRRLREGLFFSARITETLMLLSSAAMFFAAGPLVGLFINESETVAYGARFLQGFCLAQPFLAFDFLCVGVFQAVGMGKESLTLAILRKVALEIPLLYLLNALFPLYGLPYAQAVAECVMAAVAGWMLLRFLRRLPRGEKRTGQTA